LSFFLLAIIGLVYSVEEKSRYMAPLYLHAERNDEINPYSSRYIVVLNKVSTAQFQKELDVVQKLFAEEDILYVYKHAFQGYAVNVKEASKLDALRANPNVAYVEIDGVARTADCSVPEDVETWGLSRISEQEIRLDYKYTYPTEAGEDVHIYILDTGIYVAHNDFSGRAVFDWKAETGWSNDDRNGHGTHVASTSAGDYYGVAPKARLHAVKVLGDNGSGSWAGVIAGIDYTIGKGSSQKAVINMSLGGGRQLAVNAATNAAVNAGITVAVAAGNSNSDSCNFSPASAELAVSVGSTDVSVVGERQIDVRSSFSNWGAQCTDVFAPGTLITAAWIGSPTAIRSISGTSMASPHVAGVAALLLSTGTAKDEVFDRIVSDATADVIDFERSCFTPACKASPNKLAYNGCTHV